MTKKLLFYLCAALIPLSTNADTVFSRINSLPVRNSPQNTDSIPASDSTGGTWRIPFSKFAAGTGTLPDQTGNNNKILTTNGTLASWTATPTITLTNATGLPISTGVSGLGTGIATFLATPNAANWAAAITGETGTGAPVLSTSPTLVTPNLGTPTVLHLDNADQLPASGIGSGTIAQARLGTGSDGSGTHALFDDQTYKTIAGGGDALTSGTLAQFAPTTSGQFFSIITNATGASGGVVVGSASPVFSGSPSLSTATATRLSLTGTGGNGYFELGSQTSAPATPTSGKVRLYSDASGRMTWINASGFSTSFDDSQLNASQVYSRPNKSGTFLVGDDNNLAGGTVLTVGKHYYDSFAANRTLTFSGTPVAGGNSIILRANVTAPMTLTFPASIRVGASSVTPITSLALPVGQQVLSWTYSNGAWQMVDTVSDTTGLVLDTTEVNGHPLTSDIDISGEDLLMNDLTTNDVSTSAHGFAPKGDGSTTKFLNANGDYSVPAGTGVPTGTGFRRVTSGTEDAAAIGETGTGDVVRAIVPTIAGLTDSGDLTLSGVTNATVSGDINNWAPTNFATVFSIRADASTTDRTITGIAGGVTGMTRLVTNVSSTATITLSDANASSTATNRFAFGGSNVILGPNKAALLRYDGTSFRWRLMGGTALAGDVAAPGNNKFYGTNSTGIKGYNTLAPSVTNLVAGDGAGALADSGIDPADVLTTGNIGSVDNYTFGLSKLNFTDVNLSTVLSGSTYTLVPGTNYYGDITGDKTFAFSPALTNADAPITLNVHVTGTGTWTVPTLIREGATGSTTSVSVGSTGYFTVSFSKTGAGNIRMKDDISQPLLATDIQASASSRIFGRATSGAGAGEELTLTQVLDFIGSAAQGDILYRGSSGWARLAAGTDGYRLTTHGAGANPTWAASSGTATIPLKLAATAGSFIASNTYFISSAGGALVNGTNREQQFASIAGTVTRVDVGIRVAGTNGSNEAISCYLRLNDTTDVTLTNVTADGGNTIVWFATTGLSQALSVGDKFTIKFVTPAFGTTPTNVSVTAIITLTE